jgi:hypothetical protein
MQAEESGLLPRGVMAPRTGPGIFGNCRSGWLLRDLWSGCQKKQKEPGVEISIATFHKSVFFRRIRFSASS